MTTEGVRGLAEGERAALMAWWNADWPDEETHVIDLLGDVLDQIIDARLGSGEVVEAVHKAVKPHIEYYGDEDSEAAAAAAVEAVRAALKEGEVL